MTEEFFHRSPLVCAQALIGCECFSGETSGIIIETEAYAEHGDEACHTAFRPSAREFVETRPIGTAYVYMNYGIHWLTNVLVGDPVTGERGFVLLRALSPMNGLDLMRERRAKSAVRDLCSGPGKLSQALGIDGADHGRSFFEDGWGFLEGEPLEFQATPRIGINRAVALPWRFVVRPSSIEPGNVSKTKKPPSA